MPNTESAKKRVRQNVKRRALNRWRKDRIKQQIRSFMKAVQAHDVEAAEAEYRKAASLLDKVAHTSRSMTYAGNGIGPASAITSTTSRICSGRRDCSA